jgi:hypothetical protein
MGVDLVEADGDVSKSEKPTDVFPAGATEYLAIADRPIENIIERGGYIYFNYRGATGVEDVLGIEAKVLAIYNVLGQKLADTEIQSLSHGAYVIVTSAGNYKIVR